MYIYFIYNIYNIYMLVSGRMTIAGYRRISSSATGGGKNNIKIVFKWWAPLADCITKIKNTQIYDA